MRMSRFRNCITNKELPSQLHLNINIPENASCLLHQLHTISLLSTSCKQRKQIYLQPFFSAYLHSCWEKSSRFGQMATPLNYNRICEEMGKIGLIFLAFSA